MKPKTFLIGYTSINGEGLNGYLRYTGNTDFQHAIGEARKDGLTDAEILCSFYAKLCYKALTLGENKNLSRIRNIEDNVRGTLESGHGSVFEHCWLNFVTTNCSRVFTHELVRHRVGTAFSQTSGRYVRGDNLSIVMDPILDPISDVFNIACGNIRDSYKLASMRLGLEPCNKCNNLEIGCLICRGAILVKDFTTKKKLTSALRRILPNGQVNEIGWSMNIRTLRHVIMLRTNRSAEWEIRLVFNDVYQICKEKYPLLFFDAVETSVDDLIEVTGMKQQPY
jgi:thymidylate synthase (FAD)